MGANVANYGIGKKGVNLVKAPVELDDAEGTQFQNAEMIPDEAKGGEGSLSKRGGLLALTSALAGSILGMISLPLQTTYTRYLYVSLGSAVAGNTWMRTTDGTTWTVVTSPVRASRTGDKFQTPHAGQTALLNCSRRGVSYKTRMLYAGDDYTVGTTCPPVMQWNGTDSVELFRVPIGPSSDGDEPTSITDMLLANGKIYFTVAEKASSAAFHGGRVMQYDPRTSLVKQVANAIGVGAGEVTGQNVPTCMAFFQGQLWVGLHASNSGSADVGKVIRCYPDVDTTWTTDVSNLNGKPNSLIEFKGNLYVSTSVSDNIGTITKRTSATGVWADVDTKANGDYTMLREYDSKLYAVRYFDDAADGVDIMTSSDGVTWASTRDVYLTDAASTKVRPTGAAVFGADLFYAFHPLSAPDTGTDGFIMRLRAGTWTKITTNGNISGPMLSLVQRS